MPTRTYYKHKRVEDTYIPYNFQCESCMKNSGNLKAHIVGDEATYNSNFPNISDTVIDNLEKQAHTNLVAKVKEAYNDATEKDIYCTEFKDECPHCHKPQTWGVSGLKKKRFDTPIVVFLVGVIFFLIALAGHFFSDLEYMTIPLAFGILGVGFVAAIAVLIWNTIKINIKIKETSASGTKNLPNIDWNKIQDLLNEEK